MESRVTMNLKRSNGFRREMDKGMDVSVMTCPFKHSMAFWETECNLPNWWNSGWANIFFLRNVCQKIVLHLPCTTETFWNCRLASDRSGDLIQLHLKFKEGGKTIPRVYLPILSQSKNTELGNTWENVFAGLELISGQMKLLPVVGSKPTTPLLITKLPWRFQIALKR